MKPLFLNPHATGPSVGSWRSHRTTIVVVVVALAVLLFASQGCSLFDACTYQDARCADGQIEICNCEGAGGGQLLTGCKSPTAWEVFPDACRRDDLCLELSGGAVCVPIDLGPCVNDGFPTECLSDDVQRVCVSVIGSQVESTAQGGRPGVISDVPCRETETCETGEDWAGCVTPI